MMAGLRLFIAGIAPLSLVAPAAAQSMDHAAHGALPMSMPMPAPVSTPPACTPEHAAMGHCTLAPAPAPPMPAPAPAPAGHAHHMPAAPPADAAAGTDLAPGHAPAPPPPGDWYADRFHPAAQMDRARHQMMAENGAQTQTFATFNLAEYQARKGRDGFRWDAQAWHGGDINRIVVKSEGEGAFGEGVDHAEAQVLYSRAIGPYFDVQAGVRQDLGSGPDRTYATIGVEGLAPYWFDVEGAVFLSNKGDFLARVAGHYDQRITQRLIAQPLAELNFAAQDVPETRIGSGLSDFELGLRLRYEIVKELAPYVGVEWARKVGDTARFTRAAGEDADTVSFVMGVRAWF